MKNCEQFMDQYLMLDKGEILPFKLSLHLLACRECRKEIRTLTKAQKLAGKPLKITVPSTDKSITKAMQSIDINYDSSKVHVPLFQWIIAGVIMIVAFFLFGLLTNTPTHEVNAIYYLLFAGSITAYCMLFVGTNLDFFIKKIDIKGVL